MKTKRNGHKVFASMLIVAALCLLAACIDPITKMMATQVKDGIAPVISITSPAEGYVCANVVEIVGTVTDAATETGNDGKASALSYSVSGSTVSDTVEIAADGSFVFQFSTVTLGTNFTLAVTAADWNGNTTTVLLPLCRQSGSGIPTFAVSPGNQQATLTWTAVPHASSYTLYYTTNGSLPSEQVGTKVANVTSPYTVSSLTDGNLHVFQLKTVPETDWPESVSDYAKAIPLSLQTLAPRVTGGVSKITIEWDPIAAADEYEVWRSTAQNGTYANLSGTVTGSAYVDTGVSDSTVYWYKVRPTLEGSVFSHANCAQTDPFSIYRPCVVGVCDTDSAQAVALSGSSACVADDYGGLRIVDVSDPSSPEILATWPGTTMDVAVSNPYAYIVGGGTAMQVVDLTNPGSPSLKGSRTGLTNASAVDVSGSYAYVADYSAGLRIINISNPASPSITSTYATYPNLHAVAAWGSYAYTADSSAVYGVNATTPGSPSAAGSYAVSGVSSLAVCEAGTYAYAACGANGLYVLNIIGHNSVSYTTKFTGYPNSVMVSGSYLYVTDLYAGLRIYDISTPSAPVLKATVTSTAANGAAASGSYAYIADGVRGLRVIEIPAPAENPSIVGTYGTSMTAYGVAVSGSYAYVADGNSGLKVIDVSTPAAPVRLGSCFTVNAQGVAVSGTYAYIADPSASFCVIDVSTPASPTCVGSLNAVKANGVAVLGTYAYAAAGASGLQVIDISDPTAPSLVSTCATTDARGVAVSGSYAYVADYTSGLRVIDISDPTNPTLVNTCSTTAYSVAVSDSYAYVGTNTSLAAISIADPTGTLSIADTCATPATCYNVAVSGYYAYVAAYGSGLQVIDISTPTSLFLRGACDTSGTAYGVAMSGTYAYIADYTSGLRVIDLDP